MIFDAVASRTLPDLLSNRVKDRPEKTFLTFIDKDMKTAGKYTYAELDVLSDRVAAYLQKVGIKKGDFVCLHMPNVPEFLFSWIGIAKAGAVMVATNLKSAPDEMEYYLTHSESKVLLSHTDHMDSVEPILGKTGIKEIALAGDSSKIGKRT
ncbi:MAG: AMP-binding protein, partial [Bdellovibrionota bacterium]